MKHLILFFMFSFFIVFNMDVNAKVELSVNEYKIEQQQKSIDELKAEIKELKKEIDDTKEKKIENKKDNESLDKRIGDISGNVDRFGIIAGILGLLITIVSAISGWLGYTKAKTESKEVAKEEAYKVTENWIKNEANKQLQDKIKELEIDAQEKIAEAVKTAKDEIKQQSEAEDLFLQGRSYHLNKEYEIAKEYYNKALKAGHISALNNLGALYCKQGNYEKAEKYYNKALESGDNRALINFGNLYKDQKEYEKAEEFYKKAIDAGYTGALNNLGVLYNEQKEYEKAEEYFKKAIDAGINDALNNLGNLYYGQKEYEKAEDYYKKAIDAGNNSALNNLRILYTEQNEHTKLEELNQNIKFN